MAARVKVLGCRLGLLRPRLNVCDDIAAEGSICADVVLYKQKLLFCTCGFLCRYARRDRTSTVKSAHLLPWFYFAYYEHVTLSTLSLISSSQTAAYYSEARCGLISAESSIEFQSVERSVDHYMCSELICVMLGARQCHSCVQRFVLIF